MIAPGAAILKLVFGAGQRVTRLKKENEPPAWLSVAREGPGLPPALSLAYSPRDAYSM
jgi:hypothetical protein